MKYEAIYMRSNLHEKGIELWYEYRGRYYSVIKSNMYPESLKVQHDREQNHIDQIVSNEENRKDNPDAKSFSEEAEYFFKVAGIDD